MSTENPQDKALHQQADTHKRDLSEGANVRVPKGDEAGPGERIDPFAARKAMFAKADAVRDAEAAQGGSVQDAALAEAAKEAGIDLDALRRGHMGDPGGAEGTAPAEPTSSRTLHLNKDKTGEPASTAPSPSGDGYVTVRVNGAEIKVAQRDVDRAGGAEAYARNRELENERETLARQQAEVQRQIAELNKLRQELQQGAQHSAAHGTEPADRAAAPAAQDRNDPGNTGVEDDKLAQRLADQIYSGDQAVAEKGVRELIRLARQRGEAPDVKAIVEQVRAELAATPGAEGNQSTTPASTAQKAPVNPVIERVNRQVNAMAAAEFPDLMKNAAGKAAAYERFLELVKLPANADRLAVDIAREACEEIEPKFIERRQDIVERKRGLQATSAASAQRGDATEQVDDDPSAVIAQMAAARRFGRRPQQ